MHGVICLVILFIHSEYKTFALQYLFDSRLIQLQRENFQPKYFRNYCSQEGAFYNYDYSYLISKPLSNNKILE